MNPNTNDNEFLPRIPKYGFHTCEHDPDFIEPDFGPMTGVLELDNNGRVTGIRALTPEEKAEDDERRASRPARIAAQKSKKKKK